MQCKPDDQSDDWTGTLRGICYGQFMKYLYMVLCLLMLLFVGVQYNDPDGMLWMAIYLVPAIWAGIAAFQPDLLQGSLARVLLAVCTLGALAGVAHYWPDTPQWWSKDVWWNTETAREGMGMMILLAVLLLVWIAVMRKPRVNENSASSSPTRPASS